MRSIAMPLRALAIASTLALGSQGALAEQINMSNGSLTQIHGFEVTGHIPLRFDPNFAFIAALNAARVELDAIAPATTNIARDSRNKYIAISVDMPLKAAVGELTGNSGYSLFVPRQIETSGGMRLRAMDDGFTNTGGSLSVANLRIDLDDKRVYGDLTGGNEVGFLPQMHLWNFAVASGAEMPASCAPMGALLCNVGLNPEFAISGLAATSDAFDLFTRSLGFTAEGVAALRRVTDYGTLVATIPETSTAMQMGLGLAGLGALAMRRRGTYRTSTVNQ